MAKANFKLNTNGRVVSEFLTNYRDTFRAFTELINNSLQAGATEIQVYTKTNNKKRSNYFSYVDRASRITGNPEINNQVVRHHATVFNAALARRLKKF